MSVLAWFILLTFLVLPLGIGLKYRLNIRNVRDYALTPDFPGLPHWLSFQFMLNILLSDISKSLVICGILANVMSLADSYLNTAGVALYHGLINPPGVYIHCLPCLSGAAPEQWLSASIHQTSDRNCRESKDNGTKY